MAELASFVAVVREVHFGDRAVPMPGESSLRGVGAKESPGGGSFWFVVSRTVVKSSVDTATVPKIISLVLLTACSN